MSMYIKIDNLKFNQLDCFYKRQIDTNMSQATIFNDNYIYYYKDSDSGFKRLGKFKGYTKVSSGSRDYGIDFEAYKFEDDIILMYNKENIYCTGISEEEFNDKMIYLTNLTYDNCPVFCNKIFK